MTKNRLRLNVFGRFLDIERVGNKWIAFDKGNEGKRRRATDIVIPSSLKQSELITYLDDLLHESATASSPNIIDLDQ
ncbi:MAG: hypothetical protein OER96_03820 [Gammaproteobacteria bacterium]|nr:hypothetical protein [Gammaproteobacteria bacterium]